MYKIINKEHKFKYKGCWFKVEKINYDCQLIEGMKVYFNPKMEDIRPDYLFGVVYLSVTNKKVSIPRETTNLTLKTILEVTQ